MKAAGTAITGGPDLPPPPAGYGRSPPQYGSGGIQQTGRPPVHPHQQQHGFNKPPPPGSQGFGQRTVTHSSTGRGGPTTGESAMAGVGGLFGKIKNIFAGDGDEQPGPPRRPPAGPPGYGYGQQAALGQKPPPPPPSSYGHPPGQQQPPVPRQGQSPFDDIYSRGTPPPPSAQQQQQQQPGFRQQGPTGNTPFGEYNERDDPYGRQSPPPPQQNEFQQQPPPSDLFSGRSLIGFCSWFCIVFLMI